MSTPTCFKRAGRGGIALAIGVAFAAFPGAVQASPVDLGTAGPFVVLGADAVTNTGPSTLHGDLGVATGTSLIGFGSPAVVNGTTHNNDQVANEAQDDLTEAYGVAAGQPVPPANDLTGTDLGNRTLTAGAYRYASSAQLTGKLTLDAEGDPDAQFVFKIGSTLTTASASSVELIGDASPCNVFWQVGSSATLDSSTAFQGNVMALADITLNDAASVVGRVLALDGQITLINNVLDASECDPPSTPPPSGDTPPPSGGTPPSDTGTPTTSTGTPGSTEDAPATTPTAISVPRPGAVPHGGTTISPATAGRVRGPTHGGTAIVLRAPRPRCTDGFRATVRGKLIKRVAFSLDGRPVANRSKSPFAVLVRAPSGRHTIKARVTFKDATHAKTFTFAYRACAAAALHPRRGPSVFAG